MRVQQLRNYGKGLVGSVPDPESIDRMIRASRKMQEELRAELGETGTAGLMSRTDELVASMRSHDWSGLRERGLTDQQFLEGIIRRIALMKGLAEAVGIERASAIQRRLLDRTIYDLMAPIWPTVEEYRACGDFFETFVEYFRASLGANERSGLHRIEILVDTRNHFEFNVTYCAWHEVAVAFGDPYLCYPSTCYGDEVTIPAALRDSGCRFLRVGTLATGSPVCDFTFKI